MENKNNLSNDEPFRREGRKNAKDHRHKLEHQQHRNVKELDCWTHTRKYIHSKPRFALDVALCVRYFHNAIPPAPTVDAGQLTVLVENTDTLTMAQRFVSLSGKNELTAVLNMMSNRKPGGGVVNGARSQEENIARRSNLVLGLNKKFYPLDDYALLYSPEIMVFKDADYNMCDEFKCAVISCAAIRHPKLLPSGVYHDSQRTLMEQKIRAILDVAVHHKVSNLVLGAFGCGAFGNPPRTVAYIFKQLLIDQKYAGHFKRVGFAILVGKPEETVNLECFEKAFTTPKLDK